MLKKDSKTNLDVAQLVVKPVNKQMVEEILVVVEVMLANHVKCILQFVQAVEHKLKYLSNPLVTNRYIVAIVTNQCAVTKV